MVDLIKVTGKVDGFDELGKLLSALPAELEKKVIYSAARATANLAAKDMRALAGRLGTELDDAHRFADRDAQESYAARPRKPRKAGGSSDKYGRLVDNITVRRTPSRIGAVVTTGKAYWAFFYEFGSRHQPARPIFRRLWQSRAPDYQSKFLSALVKGLENTAKKLAGSYATARKILRVGK